MQIRGKPFQVCKKSRSALKKKKARRMRNSGENENLMNFMIVFRDREQKNNVEKFKEKTPIF